MLARTPPVSKCHHPNHIENESWRARLLTASEQAYKQREGTTSLISLTLEMGSGAASSFPSSLGTHAMVRATLVATLNYPPVYFPSEPLHNTPPIPLTKTFRGFHCGSQDSVPHPPLFMVVPPEEQDILCNTPFWKLESRGTEEVFGMMEWFRGGLKK